ncbi:MAG: right-handed parallel beta-helix repeat-containing protein [Chthoniobacterales bacterium]|nr:right-handed parallel beta-helix repeat-containing protein [Chthoniobacterales bacterium]
MTFHVTTNGSDANEGSETKPFATLQRARDEIRKFKGDAPLREPLTVVVHGGIYVQSGTLELGPHDSGTLDFPVVWQAMPNAEVRVTGGPTLPADAFHPVTDDKVLAVLNTNARGNVVQLDLRSRGELQLSEYPEKFRGVPAAPELFFNDQRMTVARWPNTGWATIAKIVESGSVPREGDTSGKPGVFEYTGDEPSRWRADAGVWLQGYWCYDWYDEAIKIKSIDRDARRITFAAPAHYGVKQGNPSPRRFRAINVLEELDEPGEHYIDRAARLLYFWPPAAIGGARVALSTLNAPLLRLKDAEHVTIRGMIFEASLASGMEVQGGRSVRIESCTVRNTREFGIRVTGGTEHRVECCDITDTGTGGLVLEGGDRKTLTPGKHEAINNHIWNFSRHQQTGAYGISLGGVGNRAAHNLVHDAPHQAIYLGGNDHIFEFNIVRNVVTETDDAGAVYKGRNPSCRGNVIRHNFFKDIGSPMGHGTAAIYFDDGDGGDVVFGNIFLRSGHPGNGVFGTIFSHGGHGIRAENNIFVDCKRAFGSAPWDDALWKDAVNGGQGMEWQPKLLQEVDVTRPPYTTHYPELLGFMNPVAGAVRVSRARNNVLIRCSEKSSGNWTADENEIWATDADPGFVDAAGENFKLREDAEVFKRLPAFQPIPFDQIGMHRSGGGS